MCLRSEVESREIMLPEQWTTEQSLELLCDASGGTNGVFSRGPVCSSSHNAPYRLDITPPAPGDFQGASEFAGMTKAGVNEGEGDHRKTTPTQQSEFKKRAIETKDLAVIEKEIEKESRRYEKGEGEDERLEKTETKQATDACLSISLDGSIVSIGWDGEGCWIEPPDEQKCCGVEVIGYLECTHDVTIYSCIFCNCLQHSLISFDAKFLSAPQLQLKIEDEGFYLYDRETSFKRSEWILNI